MGGSLPQSVRAVGAATGVLFGGFVAVTMGAAVTYETVRKSEVARRRMAGMMCVICRAKGFYPCKLCRGDSTIQWSPLNDPLVINPCLCPTCDGRKVQRCLNCLGKGYV